VDQLHDLFLLDAGVLTAPCLHLRVTIRRQHNLSTKFCLRSDASSITTLLFPPGTDKLGLVASSTSDSSGWEHWQWDLSSIQENLPGGPLWLSVAVHTTAQEGSGRPAFFWIGALHLFQPDSMNYAHSLLCSSIKTSTGVTVIGPSGDSLFVGRGLFDVLVAWTSPPSVWLGCDVDLLWSGDGHEWRFSCRVPANVGRAACIGVPNGSLFQLRVYHPTLSSFFSHLISWDGGEVDGPPPGSVIDSASIAATQ
jgi:hypothetical protein